MPKNYGRGGDSASRSTKVLFKLFRRGGMPLAPNFNLMGASPGRDLPRSGLSPPHARGAAAGKTVKISRYTYSIDRFLTANKP